MFNNLIESTSHRREMKRRGSFLLFTTATYALLFVVAGVISIYAYEARLEEQNLELVTMMPLVDLPSPVNEPPRVNSTTPKSPDNNGRDQNFYERATAMASVNNPNVAPLTVSTEANKNQPLPDSGIVRFTGRDVNPSGVPGTTGNGGNSGVNTKPTVITVDSQPPAPPEPKPIPRQISKGVITSEALSLPKPGYPPIAMQAGAKGRVSVQVLIDEKGSVIHAQAMSGHPLLTAAAVKAAYLARFSPTLLSGQPVKVSGVINYDFQR